MSRPPAVLHGLNFLKLLSLFVVVFFHFGSLVWEYHRDLLALRLTEHRSLYVIFEMWEHVWYMGWTIMAVAAFLIGMKSARGKPPGLRLFLFLIIAWPFACWAFFSFGRFELYWDVYPALAVGFLACTLLTKLQLSIRPRSILVFVSALTTVAAVWPNLRAFDNSHLNAIFFGGCRNLQSGFPIFPLVPFLIALFFCGQLYYEGAWGWLRRPKYIAIETALWAIGLVVIPYVGLGPRFYTWAYDRFTFLDAECLSIDFMRLAFWAPFLWIILLMRLSLIESVNERLLPLLASLTRFKFIQHFGIAYLVSFFMGALFSYFFREQLMNNVFLFYAAGFSLLPLTEFILRLFWRRNFN